MFVPGGRLAKKHRRWQITRIYIWFVCQHTFVSLYLICLISLCTSEKQSFSICCLVLKSVTSICAFLCCFLFWFDIYFMNFFFVFVLYFVFYFSILVENPFNSDLSFILTWKHKCTKSHRAFCGAVIVQIKSMFSLICKTQFPFDFFKCIYLFSEAINQSSWRSGFMFSFEHCMTRNRQTSA